MTERRRVLGNPEEKGREPRDQDRQAAGAAADVVVLRAELFQHPTAICRKEVAGSAG